MKSQRPPLMNPALYLILAVTFAACAPLTAQAQRRDARDDKPELLTDEQIDLIRVYEVDLKAEQDPRIRIPNDTLDDFLSKYQSDDRVPRGDSEQRAFKRADGRVQLRLMFDLQAREFYKDVRIGGRIPAFSEWSTQHRRYVMPYFYRHFGEGQVEGLKLVPRGPDGKRIEMTNFYLLTQTKINGRRLIDRSNPDESLLLQWGLPRDEAKFPAPDIDGWRPYFKDANDRRFVELVDWVKMLYLSNQDKNYDVEFTLPDQEDE